MILIENDDELPVLDPKVYRGMLRRSASSHSTTARNKTGAYFIISILSYSLLE
jgi:hypothetical protein